MTSRTVSGTSGTRSGARRQSFAAGLICTCTLQVQSVLDFDRNRKSMSVAVTGPDGLLLLVKGAPESILPRCAHVLASSGSCTDMTADLHDVVLQQMRKYASNVGSSCAPSEGRPQSSSPGDVQGMRCLALAMKSDPVLSADPDQFASVEQGLTFVGMVAMLDPPRPGVRDAVRRCATAGVRVVVVTGDNVHTASAICLRIGASTGAMRFAGTGWVNAFVQAYSIRPTRSPIAASPAASSAR